MTVNGKTLKDRATILIAEDDEGHAFLIRKNLSRHGIENPVILFTDGQEVMDFFTAPSGVRGHVYDRGTRYLLLLDVRMPKIDGTEVLRRLKSIEHLKMMPVIMVTTTEDPVDVEKCRSLGCTGYITKPVDYGKLTKAIENTGLL